MKNYKIIIVIFFILSFISSCKNSSEPAAPEGVRVGAVCKDGSRTTATGSGACSHHGGVDYWIYE